MRNQWSLFRVTPPLCRSHWFLKHDKFMTLLIRLCDHLGKLLALVGSNTVREPYVVE